MFRIEALWLLGFGLTAGAVLGIAGKWFVVGAVVAILAVVVWRLAVDSIQARVGQVESED